MRDFAFPGRSPVYATRAMCATSHPLASVAAIEQLKKGGNAVDAAIAAVAVLSVVEQPMTGIGGDCFALIAKPGGKPIALNGSGRAPKAATTEWYAAKGIRTIEATTAHAVTVPGAIDAWTRLLADHGSRSLAEVLAAAIELARGGFPIAPRVATDWAAATAKLERHAGARQHLLPRGRAPRVGEVVRFPALARTLEIIAREGRDGFYEGEVAADIVAELNELGGLHTLEDFAAQSSSYVEPISVHYRGAELYELPPSNQGIVALILLRMLDRLGSLGNDPWAGERYHVMMEACRLAYALRDRFVADPETTAVPVTHLLSDRLIDELVARIDLKRRQPHIAAHIEPTGSDTVCLAVVDGDGMAVSLINSLFADFGSGIVTRKTGVTLHNRGQGFVLNPRHPNAIGPRKRPMHTLAPALAMKGHEPWLCFGVMGAAFQPMGHVYVMTNMLDYGMDAQEALDHPRAFIEDDTTVLERSLPQSIADDLVARGHTIAWRPLPWGGGQIVEIDRRAGVLIGASDPRKDGLAIGY